MEELQTTQQSDRAVFSTLLDKLNNDEVSGIFPQFKIVPDYSIPLKVRSPYHIINIHLPMLSYAEGDELKSMPISRAASERFYQLYQHRTQHHINQKDKNLVKKFFVGLAEDLMTEFPEEKNN